jgi:hypothetical protein
MKGPSVTVNSHDPGPTSSSPGPDDPAPKSRGLRATVGSALSGAIATVMGLIPHLLHHVSFFAGAVLVTGATGNLLFGVLGLLFSIPLLRRLHRRYHTWKAPAAALGVFAAMFTFSTLVLGPALTGEDNSASTPERPAPSDTLSPEEHDEHHGG